MKRTQLIFVVGRTTGLKKKEVNIFKNLKLPLH